MPKLPQEALSSVLKPGKGVYAKLKIGDKVHFTITGPHKVSIGNLFSIPVKDSDGNTGNFSLNKTHAGMFSEVFGENTDDWVKVSFTAIVVPQNNPQTNVQVKSWNVDRDSITAGRKR